MTYAPAKDGFELTEQNDEDVERKVERRILCRRLCIYIFVTVFLVAVMGLLMAMFGPGSKDLRYRETKDCKGKNCNSERIVVSPPIKNNSREQSVSSFELIVLVSDLELT